MKPIELSFTHKAETKNKQRFEEVVADGAKPVVGTLYVGKDEVGEVKTLRVTIESAE